MYFKHSITYIKIGCIDVGILTVRKIRKWYQRDTVVIIYGISMDCMYTELYSYVTWQTYIHAVMFLNLFRGLLVSDRPILSCLPSSPVIRDWNMCTKQCGLISLVRKSMCTIYLILHYKCFVVAGVHTGNILPKPLL